jgi:DNA polymerase V
MKKPIYALIDCNNFYVSCERVFNPDLADKPVAVLSNNDGCFVARSPEVKKLGIPMGAPIFEHRDIVKKHNVKVFSSNYELYGDLSRRVMDTLTTFTDNIEIYSIDEAFLRLENQPINDLTELGRKIKERVFKWTGVPVSVGIASTKTLAKIANEFAKKTPGFAGALSLNGLSQKDINEYLKKTELVDIWGIGPGYKLPDSFVRDNMTVMGLRTKMELLGTSCIPLEEIVKPKKGIVSSRSFNYLVRDLQDLKESVSYYTTRACEKLRSQNSKAKRIDVFITTNRFRLKDKQYHASIHQELNMHSNSTQMFIEAALSCLKKIYRKGYNYKKAGVYISGIIPENSGQMARFVMEAFNKASVISKIVDKINGFYGKEAVIFASSGVGKKWIAKSEQKSPRFTTKWEELLVVK